MAGGPGYGGREGIEEAGEHGAGPLSFRGSTGLCHQTTMSICKSTDSMPRLGENQARKGREGRGMGRRSKRSRAQ